MPGEDSLSSRFDYLFEPLDEAESADATVVAASSANDSADDGKSSHSAVPVRMAFAAFVLATLAGAAVVALLLLQRPPGAVEPVDSTRLPAPLSTTVANVPSPPRPVAPPAATIEPGPALPTSVGAAADGAFEVTRRRRLQHAGHAIADQRGARNAPAVHRTCHHNKVDRTRVICFPESACPDRYDARARRISSSPRRPRRRCRSRARRSHRAPGLVPTTDRAPPNRPTAVPTCIRHANGRRFMHGG